MNLKSRGESRGELSSLKAVNTQRVRSTQGRSYLTKRTLFLLAFAIAQFRIPGRTGASCVKPTKMRLMRGRNKSTRAVEMVNHHCCAFNCTNSTQKQKNVEKYLELANVRVFSISLG